MSKNVGDEITLHTVDESVVETGDIMKDIAVDPGHRQCLEALCRCMDLVHWIRTETKSMMK